MCVCASVLLRLFIFSRWHGCAEPRGYMPMSVQNKKIEQNLQSYFNTLRHTKMHYYLTDELGFRSKSCLVYLYYIQEKCIFC